MNHQTVYDLKNLELNSRQTKNNSVTIRIDLRNVYEESEHSLQMFSDVIQMACQNKTLLDLKYIVQTNETGKFKTLK